MSRIIPLVALILTLSAGLTTADISIVADIDLDYTNGPDSLLMDAGDTVQVNIWITGEDSLVGFGVTLGDTSGALLWIEEPESSVYTTPLGWTNINIMQDSLGWILIQSSDFSASTPLVSPSKVAEMDFVVAPGESCGVIVIDPELSGWQDVEFVEGEFNSYIHTSICVTSVERVGGGSGDDPEYGGGYSFNCSDQFVAEQPIDFSGYPRSYECTFGISESDYLFINGHRLSGMITCSWEAGLPLLVNNYSVLPAPNSSRSPLSSDQKRVLYENVPLVDSLLSIGLSFAEAEIEWKSRVYDLGTYMGRIYFEVWSETSSQPQARETAIAVLAECGKDIVSRDHPPSWSNDILFVHWEGRERVSRYLESFLKKPPIQSNYHPKWYNSLPTYIKAKKWVDSVKHMLEGYSSSVVIIPSVGGIIGTSTREVDSRSDYDLLLNQIRSSTEENIVNGPLSESTVLEILLEGGLDQ